MENLRKELIDFAQFAYENSLGGITISDNLIDDYLKSINSAPCERKADSNNETKGKKLNPEYCNFFNTCEDDICNAGARCACDTRIKF